MENKYDSESAIDPQRPLAPKAHSSEVVIGVLLGLDAEKVPLVAYPQSPSELGSAARTLVALCEDDIGGEVALVFEMGDASRPLILGRVRKPEALRPGAADSIRAAVDGDSLELTAEKDIVLRCGKASITLTRAGKVLIRGTYILSRSSGANRIKGGSINLN